MSIFFSTKAFEENKEVISSPIYLFEHWELQGLGPRILTLGGRVPLSVLHSCDYHRRNLKGGCISSLVAYPKGLVLTNWLLIPSFCYWGNNTYTKTFQYSYIFDRKFNFKNSNENTQQLPNFLFKETVLTSVKSWLLLSKTAYDEKGNRHRDVMNRQYTMLKGHDPQMTRKSDHLVLLSKGSDYLVWGLAAGPEYTNSAQG